MHSSKKKVHIYVCMQCPPLSIYMVIESYPIKSIYWWEFTCELSEVFISLCPSCYVFCVWKMSGHFPRTPDFFPLYHFIHWWFDCFLCLDLSGSMLICFLLISLFFSFYLICLIFIILRSYWFTSVFNIFFASFLYILLTIWCFSITIFWLVCSCWTSLGSYLMRFSVHIAFYTWGYGIFIIGYLSLVSFHFFYPIALAYITSYVLRPP